MARSTSLSNSAISIAFRPSPKFGRGCGEHLRKALTVFLFLFISLSAFSQQSLVFNEVMQSNINCVMADNDFPDSWVELYNPTTSAISLSRYALGEHKEPSRAYTFNTSVSVPAGGHVLIYCDKVGEGLHTDFRIDAGKDTLRLFNPSGEIVDELILGKMAAPNVAYGRVTDGAGEWHFEHQPTPGTANAGGGSDHVLSPPVFSTEGGLFTDTYFFTVSVPDDAPDDAGVFFTIDGTEPTIKSSAMRQLSMSISSSRVVRAKVISRSGNGVASETVTRSFIYHPRQNSLPVVSIATDPNYLNDDAIGILSSTVNNGVPNYMQKWRRPVNIELFDPQREDAVLLNQQAETAVSGVSTREFQQKSLKLYANKRFGKKRFGDYLWQDKPEVKSVKSFILRNGGNNTFTTRLNDGWVQRLFGLNTPAGLLDWQAYQPVVVYVNGKFQGEYAMRERSDEDYVEANYDGLEDIEMRETMLAPTDITRQNIDLRNFAASLIVEMYARNTDYPTNNVSLWRPATEDGQWRFILKDIDRAGVLSMMVSSQFDMFDYMFSSGDGFTYKGSSFNLYQQLIKTPDFRELFLDMFSAWLGDFLRPEVALALLDAMDDEIRQEVKATFQLFNESFINYTQEMIFLRNFVQQRQSQLYSQMANYFSLGNLRPVSVDAAGCELLVNSLPSATGSYEGQCFTRRPLRFSSSEAESWTVTYTRANGVTHDTVMGTDLTLQPTDDILSIQVQLNKRQDTPTCVSIPTLSFPQRMYSIDGKPSSASRHSVVVAADGKKFLK